MIWIELLPHRIAWHDAMMNLNANFGIMDKNFADYVQTQVQDQSKMMDIHMARKTAYFKVVSQKYDLSNNVIEYKFKATNLYRTE